MEERGGGGERERREEREDVRLCAEEVGVGAEEAEVVWGRRELEDCARGGGERVEDVEAFV